MASSPAPTCKRTAFAGSALEARITEALEPPMIRREVKSELAAVNGRVVRESAAIEASTLRPSRDAEPHLSTTPRTCTPRSFVSRKLPAGIAGPASTTNTCVVCPSAGTLQWPKLNAAQRIALRAPRILRCSALFNVRCMRDSFAWLEDRRLVEARGTSRRSIRSGRHQHKVVCQGSRGAYVRDGKRSHEAQEHGVSHHAPLSCSPRSRYQVAPEDPSCACGPLQRKERPRAGWPPNAYRTRHVGQ